MRPKASLDNECGRKLFAHDRIQPKIFKHQSTLIFNEYFPAVIVFGFPFEAVTVAIVPSGISIVSEAM